MRSASGTAYTNCPSTKPGYTRPRKRNRSCAATSNLSTLRPAPGGFMKRTLLWFSLVFLGPGALWTAASPINDPQGVLDNFIAGIPITPEAAFKFHAILTG